MSLISFGGLASGIQSKEIIEAISMATRRQRVEPNLQKISRLKDTNAALGEFKGMLSKFQGLSFALGTLSGGAIPKLATSSNEQFVTASASNSALNGSYDLNVTNLAKNGTISFQTTGTTYTSPTDKVAPSAGPGTILFANFTIGEGVSSEVVSLVFDNNTTLEQFVSMFNEQSNSATATLVNVGTTQNPDLRPVITSKETGTNKGKITFISGSDPAIPGVDYFFQNQTLSQAENAKFTMAGIGGEIERSSNTINDLVPGVTFKLQAPGSAKITIENDTSLTKEKVQDLVKTYNNILDFVRLNSTITRDDSGSEPKINFGPLSSTKLASSALTSLRSAINSSALSGGGAVRIFADLGITTKRDGTLDLDESKFEEALSSNPEAVNDILKKFGDNVGATDGVIAQYIKFNSLIDLGVQANERQISNINETVNRAEQFILNQEKTLMQRFGRLESLIGGLQSQQSALTSALAGLGFYR